MDPVFIRNAGNPRGFSVRMLFDLDEPIFERNAPKNCSKLN